jgi:hypothetical protein
MLYKTTEECKKWFEENKLVFDIRKLEYDTDNKMYNY